jgi:hypothetical protein
MKRLAIILEESQTMESFACEASFSSEDET